MPRAIPAKIELTSRVRALVDALSRQSNAEYRLVRRARLLLAMANGTGNRELSRTHAMDRGVIQDWRARWSEFLPTVTAAEAAMRNYPPYCAKA